MVFTMCPFGRPQYTARAASDHAREYRRRGWPDAKAVRCPGGDGHWHAVTGGDDMIAQAAEARRRLLAEAKAAYERSMAENRRRSEAMVEGMRHFGGA